MRIDPSDDNPLLSDSEFTTMQSSELEDLLDFIEDMVLMKGCPYCNSLAVKIIETDLGRILLCLDCGNQEMLPPPN